MTAGSTPIGSPRVRPNIEHLRQVGRDAGLDAVGVATAEPFTDTRRDLEARRHDGLSAGMAFTYRNPARSTEPEQALAGAQSLVVGARAYRRQEPPTAPAVAPARVARYSWVDHYAPLREALGRVADELTGAGWRARVLADDNALVDRAAAQRAGLGWYGKNTNILLPGRGSWFVLGAVVTDAPLTPDVPVPDGCGACSRCLPACPTGALVAPGVLDARRCLAWLLQAPGVFPAEHRVALGDRIYGCDECQEVCPPNRLDQRRRPGTDPGPGATPTTDMVDLLCSSDAELLDRWGRWYIARRDPVHLRRNALVVLGNVGDPAAPEVRAALTAALGHPHPLVRAHAVWAAARLGLHGLLDAVADTDPLVRTELAAAPEVELRAGLGVARPTGDVRRRM